jgi:hypothetical protein
LRPSEARGFPREQHIVDDATPLQQQRLLKHHADVARGVERLRLGADLTSPESKG